MRIGLISDIHSNIYALNEVLLDIDSKNIDLIVCLGDLVGYCPFPNEVIDTIRDRKILTVKGNYDEAVGEELMVCGCDYPNPKDAENAGISLNWAIDKTTYDNKQFLKTLAKEISITIDNKKILFVHGSPRKINEYLKENSTEANEVMKSLQENILICGHTHKPYYKYYGEKLLINAGSVGKPKTEKPDSNYVILDIVEDKVSVEIVEVPYEYEKTASAIEKNGLPEKFANVIRTGKA